LFATEAATAGLPVHIIARLLGHSNINTPPGEKDASSACSRQRLGLIPLLFNEM
jgi:hypothetical protein